MGKIGDLSKYLLDTELTGGELIIGADTDGSTIHISAQQIKDFAIDGLDLGGGGTETASSIKTKYESNTNTNAFTDAYKDKLDAPYQVSVAEITATGTRNSTTYLRGDGTWGAVNNLAGSNQVIPGAVSRFITIDTGGSLNIGLPSAGTIVFDDTGVSNPVAPTTGNHLTNKTYVDGQLSGALINNIALTSPVTLRESGTLVGLTIDTTNNNTVIAGGDNAGGTRSTISTGVSSVNMQAAGGGNLNSLQVTEDEVLIVGYSVAEIDAAPASSLITKEWISAQSFATGTGITDIVQDTTPQLGGNLDLNGNTIIGLTIDIDDINTTGTASSSTFLRGDGSWQTISGGGGGISWSDPVDADIVADNTSRNIGSGAIPFATGYFDALVVVSSLNMQNSPILNAPNVDNARDMHVIVHTSDVTLTTAHITTTSGANINKKVVNTVRGTDDVEFTIPASLGNVGQTIIIQNSGTGTVTIVNSGGASIVGAGVTSGDTIVMDGSDTDFEFGRVTLLQEVNDEWRIDGNYDTLASTSEFMPQDNAASTADVNSLGSFTSTSAGAMTVESTIVDGGSYSLRVESVSSGQDGGTINITGITAGVPVTINFRGYENSVNAFVSLRIPAVDNTGGSEIITTIDGAAWVSYQTVFTPTRTDFNINLVAASSQINATYVGYFDNITITQ